VGDFREKINTAPNAVVQLRQEDKAGQLWNMVYFQTNLKWGNKSGYFR
jgi:methylenetetrahydrofolate--tRNA-(uracil-5-)-methyltransferase